MQEKKECKVQHNSIRLDYTKSKGMVQIIWLDNVSKQDVQLIVVTGTGVQCEIKDAKNV